MDTLCCYHLFVDSRFGPPEPPTSSTRLMFFFDERSSTLSSTARDACIIETSFKKNALNNE
jgi:hypothetical protein